MKHFDYAFGLEEEFFLSRADTGALAVDVAGTLVEEARCELGDFVTTEMLQSQIEIRTAEQKQAIAEYGRVGARAFGEVENALSSAFTLDEREAILTQLVADNSRALELANVRYRVGAGDLRAVQQQSLALHAARTALLRVQAERLVQRVNLHLALGGSFEAPPQ